MTSLTFKHILCHLIGVSIIYIGSGRLVCFHRTEDRIFVTGDSVSKETVCCVGGKVKH